MAETIHVLGEGGSVFHMALPLHGDIEKRLAVGHLRRVNPDGTPYTGTPTGTDAQVPTLPTSRPALAAAKPAWVAWAVANGMEPDTAEAATKQDLIDQFGMKPALEASE